jgi:hypothetical protein
MPEWQLKLLFGEGAQVLTHSSAVIPERLTEAGFEFSYADIEQALKNILN